LPSGWVAADETVTTDFIPVARRYEKSDHAGERVRHPAAGAGSTTPTDTPRILG